jgi:hypothetical protein
VNRDNQPNKNKVSSVSIIIEIVIGLFGIYGIGHLLSRRWVSGVLFLLFSFFWLVVEGVTKDVIFRGDFSSGLCALVFHVPIVIISIAILKKSKNKSRK